MRSLKVTAKAFRAGLHRTAHRVGPVPSGFSDRLTDTGIQSQPGSPVRCEPGRPDRRFEYSIGRRLGFHDGVPGRYWSINGQMFPQVPMFVVAEGDVVLMTVRNRSGEVHPTHLHGHQRCFRRGDRAVSPWRDLRPCQL